MKIKSTQKFIRDVAPVFVLKDGDKIKNHPFFRFLSKEDQNQLQLFEKKTKSEGAYTHGVFLASGKLAFLIGVGDKFNHRKAIIAVRRAIDAARKNKVGKLIINLEDFIAPIFGTSDVLRGSTSQILKSIREEVEPRKIEILAEVMATQFEIANFEFIKYKEPPKEGWFFVKETQIYTDKKRINTDTQRALDRGKIIGEEINRTRVLSNTPGGDMTPARLAEAAAKAGKRAGFKVKVLDEKSIRKLKMGGVLGVSQGSNERPRFIIMEYMKGKKNEKPVVLVGKGVTFDTGGLNLKPSEGIYEMHMDMSGGAAVIHTIAALTRLKAKKNIIGLVPAVENMPSGSSYRPGDLLKTMSGKTVEVLNTDAEGRIILADALTYAQKYKPRLVIDVATLTGAAEVALGQRASALFSTDSKISEKLEECGEVVYDFVWPLPLWEDYEEEIKGTFGDVANIGKTKYGGAITGAMFLWQFIKDHNWVHIDMAPRMTTIEGEYLAKGAAGAPVALLTEFLRNF